MQYSSFAESYKDPHTPDPRGTNPQNSPDVGDTRGGFAPVVFDIDSKESFQRVLAKYPVVVVDVWAKFCNPCIKLAPRYKQLAEKFRSAFDAGKVIFLKDNVEENEDIHKPLCHAVPTFFIYLNGQRHKIDSFSSLDGAVQDALEVVA